MIAPWPVGVVHTLSLISDSRGTVNVHEVFFFLVSGDNDGLKHEAKIIM
jgi:hypothetical protein